MSVIKYIRSQIINFDSIRRPIPQSVHVGFVGDNMVERLEFVLPQITKSQTATFLLDGIPDGVKLTLDGERYIVDLTTNMLGTGGVIKGYVHIDASSAVWKSDVLRLRVGELPNVDEQIEQKYPTAVGQMLQAISEHNVDMAETLTKAQTSATNAGISEANAANSAAQAVAAANSAELAASLAGEFSNDAENAANDAADSEKAAEEGAARSEAAADRAEQAAATNGYVFFEINDAGRLIMTKTENVENIDFRLSDGRLEAVYG